VQFLQPLTDSARINAREKSAGAHLPYARHVDAVTIETRDGYLMQTIRLGGLLFETADADELNYRSQLQSVARCFAADNRVFSFRHLPPRYSAAGRNYT
jgi:type IV secretion system protein VirB4